MSWRADSTLLLTLALVLISGLTALGASGDDSPDGPIAATAASDTAPPRPAGRAHPRVDTVGELPPSSRERLGRRWAAIHGVVRSADGRTVERGTVTVRGGGRSPRSEEVGPGGAFALGGLEPGTWQLLARGPDFATVSVFVERLGEGEVRLHDVTVVLSPRIRGEVVDPDGRPLAGVRITPMRRGPDGDELDAATAVETDRGGVFDVGGGSGDWSQIEASLPGFRTRTVRLGAPRFARICLERVEG